MELPLSNRRPHPISDRERRKYLSQPHPEDRSDPFVTDPNSEISELGKLALRVNEDIANYYFALGDLCAKLILNNDERLRIFYVGKALMAYQRAGQNPDSDLDPIKAAQLIDELGKWLVYRAKANPTQRNLAVALWATAQDDDDLPSPRVERVDTSSLLAHYHSGSTEDKREETVYDSREPERPTQVRPGIEPVSYSKDSWTREEENNISLSEDHESRTPLHSLDETQFGESLEPPISDDPLSDQREDKPTLYSKTPSQADDDAEYDFPVGERIEERYEVIDVRLGGMGVVYLCYDHEQREPVAIKTFQRKYLDKPRAVARFEQEAVTWINLDKHTHIVQAKLVRKINERPHIILEHISGMENMGADLRSWINSKRLTLRQCMLFALHIALGMEYATRKIPHLVHRDLKPGNIMVSHDGIAKITDFGLVQSIEPEQLPEARSTTLGDDAMQDYRLTRMDAVVGTPPYMSPEQIKARGLDVRSDIYSYGIVLFEMLTGDNPFNAQGVKEWQDAHLSIDPHFPDDLPFPIPQAMRNLTLQCLRKFPTQRPADWTELVERLSDIIREEFGEVPLIPLEGMPLQARELVNKGYSLTELGKYEAALQAYDDAIELQPDYAWAWGRKGRTLRLLERYDEGLVCYDKAIELQPNDAWSWNGKGILLDRMKRYDEALVHFERATHIDPTYVWYWYNRADVLNQLGRNEEALRMIQHALAIDPEHAKSWGKLGQIRRSMKHYRESVSAYKKAITLDDTYAWAHNGYGLSLKALGQLDEAIMAFKKAIQHKDADAWYYWYNLAEVLVDTYRYQEALEPAQQAIRANETHSHSWGKLGQVLRKLNRFDEALDAYNHAIALDSQFDWAINGKGLVLEKLNRCDEALRCYQQAAQLKPERVEYWYNQGNALLLLERYDEALQVVNHTVSLNTKYVRGWALMSSILRQMGRYDEALDAAEKALAIDPAFAHGWHEKGMALEFAQRYEQACHAYERAARCARSTVDRIPYLYKQAEMLVMVNRLSDALTILDQIVQMNNRLAHIWAKRGQVLRKLNRLDDALASYTNALEYDPDYAWAWSGRGLTYSLMGLHDEALHCFSAAVKLDPEDAWNWYSYGEALLATGDHESALSALDEAIQIAPHHAESWSKCGQALRNLGRFDEALKAYEKALELDNNFAWAWNGHGLTLRTMGKLEEALGSYERAIAAQPDMVWYYINHMSTLLDLERYDEALTSIERGLKAVPLHPAVWARHGQVLRRMHKFQLALDSYNRALELDDTYAWAWNGRGMCLTELGNLNEALDCYRMAVYYNDGDVWFWHNYAIALIKDGNLPEAVRALERALELDPRHEASMALLEKILDDRDFDENSIWYWYFRALAHYRQGKLEEARQEVQRALEIKPRHKLARNLLNKINKEPGDA